MKLQQNPSTTTFILFLMTMLFLTAAACNSNRQPAESSPQFTELSGPYLGQSNPGLVARIFAPGYLTTGIHDDGPAVFSPDGKHVYFRKYAYPHDIVGHMEMIDGKWTQPEIFKPMGRYVVSVPKFVGYSNQAFFISRAPRNRKGEPADYNIWHGEMTDTGWTDLEYVDNPVNTPEHDYLSSVANDGTLILQTYPQGPGTAPDLGYSELINGVYQKARSFGPPINTPQAEFGPAIAPDGSYLVFGGSDYVDSIGGQDLYVSFKISDGWSKPINLGPGINTPNHEKFCAISPDGKYLFFVGDNTDERGYVFTDATYAELLSRNLASRNGLGGDVYWVSTEAITALRPDPANPGNR
jgi:hypothetical protein